MSCWMKARPYSSITNRYKRVKAALNERGRRIWAASEAMELVYGGIAAVSRATGIQPRTVKSGIVELETGTVEDTFSTTQRKPGGGRQKLTEKYPDLTQRLDKLVEP